MLLELRQVSHAFGGRMAVKSVERSVEDGEILDRVDRTEAMESIALA